MHVHLVGIGGIGISALARHFLMSGHKVTGSDLSTGEIVEDLRSLGITVYNNHNKNNLSESVEMVVFSPAVPAHNPEIKKAKRLNIETKSYPEALGELTQKYFTIAVSGTHGKSTTTSMAALMLEKAGLDPTVIVGTKLKEFDNSNYRKGESDYLLIEADEWQGSLLNYSPDIIVLTNLEIEHLDYYKNIDHLISTFQQYIENLKNNGKIILNKDDENLKKLETDKGAYYFSIKEDVATDIKERLKVPGDYNVENALAVYRLGRALKIDSETILSGLSEYTGSWRRFEEKDVKINGNNHHIILDYAHHPTELKAVLKAVREKFPKDKICAIFKPHQYQRSMHFQDSFIKVFENAPIDELFITDIYSVPGREKESIKEKINSEKLVKMTDSKKVKYIPGNFDQVAKKIKENLHGGEIIVIIGAGEANKLEVSLKG